MSNKMSGYELFPLMSREKQVKKPTNILSMTESNEYQTTNATMVQKTVSAFNAIPKQMYEDMHGYDKSKIDVHPYFKGRVLLIREFVTFFSSYVITSVFNMLASATIMVILYILTNQSYEVVGTQKFGSLECFTLIAMHWMWNCFATFLKVLNLQKTLTVCTRLVIIFMVLCQMMFSLMWICTPGTFPSFLYSRRTILFITWNYLGFAILSFCVRLPSFVRNIFLIILASNISVLLWFLFETKYRFFLYMDLAIWDIIKSCSSIFQPSKQDLTKGLYLKIHIKYNMYLYENSKILPVNSTATDSRTGTGFDSTLTGEKMRSRMISPVSTSGLRTSIINTSDTPRSNRRYSEGIHIESKSRNKSRAVSSSLSLSNPIYRLSNSVAQQSTPTTYPHTSNTTTFMGISQVMSKIYQTEGSSFEYHKNDGTTTNEGNYQLTEKSEQELQHVRVEEKYDIKVEHYFGLHFIEVLRKAYRFAYSNGNYQHFTDLITINMIVTYLWSIKCYSCLYLFVQIVTITFLIKTLLWLFYEIRVPMYIFTLLISLVYVGPYFYSVIPLFKDIVYENEVPKF